MHRLSERLGIPVVPISAAKNDGVDELMRVVADTAEKKLRPRRIDFCSAGPVHRCIHTVSHVVEDHADNIGVPSRFAATRFVAEYGRNGKKMSAYEYIYINGTLQSSRMLESEYLDLPLKETVPTRTFRGHSGSKTSNNG